MSAQEEPRPAAAPVAGTPTGEPSKAMRDLVRRAMLSAVKAGIIDKISLTEEAHAREAELCAAIASLESRLASMKQEVTNERRAYAEMCCAIITETGVDVGAGGITATAAVKELRSRLASVERENAAMREDAARLDWLSNPMNLAEPIITLTETTWTVSWHPDENQWRRMTTGHATLREAIDAARQQEGSRE